MQQSFGGLMRGIAQSDRVDMAETLSRSCSSTSR